RSLNSSVSSLSNSSASALIFCAVYSRCSGWPLFHRVPLRTVMVNVRVLKDHVADAGMAASHYACQSPLNTIGLFHVTCFRDGVPLSFLSPIIRPRGCVAQFANRLWQNRGNFCYLSDAPRSRTARARRLLRSSPTCVSYTPQPKRARDTKPDFPKVY